MARSVTFQNQKLPRCRIAGALAYSRGAGWRARAHARKPCWRPTAGRLRRRSCSSSGRRRTPACPAGPAKGGGPSGPFRWPMTCAMTLTHARTWVPTKSAGARCCVSLRPAPAMPPMPPAEIVGPVTTGWPLTLAMTCAPFSAPTPCCGCSGWPPRSCAAANALAPNAWPLGGSVTAAVAGPVCGRCTITGCSTA